ncbi:MAG: hypothetical protein MI923_17825, partial [Phycisphaerales bacterium]|nr:hypothetical protein [Phycisphaerales bacterium]
MADPTYLPQAQLQLLQRHMTLWQHTARRVLGEELPDLISPERGDRRFKHADWDENQFFDFIKQSYLINASWLEETVSEMNGLDEETRKKARFFAKQVSDAFSPSNFPFTNP